MVRKKSLPNSAKRANFHQILGGIPFQISFFGGDLTWNDHLLYRLLPYSSFGSHFKHQDKGQYTEMIILDLQKAFDTVNHKILISKLRGMGVGYAALKWFDSYIWGRENKPWKSQVSFPSLGLSHVVCRKVQYLVLFYF